MIDEKRRNADRPASAAAWLTVIAAVQVLWLSPAQAQQPAPQAFGEEMAKQERIYQSGGKAVPGGYITSRGLAKYGEHLHAGFERELASLGPRHRWLDIGAGSGQAIVDYYARAGGATGDARAAWQRLIGQAIALSIEDRRTAAWHKQAAVLDPERIRYLHGKRLREYSSAELGKFRMITDVYGGFSYTEELSLFMERVLELMDLNASFYTLVQSVHLEDGSDPPTTYYLTEIIDDAGDDVKVCSWLKRVSCVAVSCESRSDWHTPTELIRVRKVCNEAAVPPLVPFVYQAGNPPARKFRLRR